MLAKVINITEKPTTKGDIYYNLSLDVDGKKITINSFNAPVHDKNQIGDNQGGGDNGRLRKRRGFRQYARRRSRHWRLLPAGQGQRNRDERRIGFAEEIAHRQNDDRADDMRKFDHDDSLLHCRVGAKMQENEFPSCNDDKNEPDEQGPIHRRHA